MKIEDSKIEDAGLKIKDSKKTLNTKHQILNTIKNSPIQLASAGMSDAPIILAQAQPPTQEELQKYLSATQDVQITPDISTLATQTLKGNPVLIYEYVRNNFDYEPYYGSLKGSQETLLEKAGNDTDLASLLIALYRAAGIPARYVKAEIRIPINAAMNWVGVKDPLTAGNLIATAGYPAKAAVEGGIIKYIYVEHTWVEIYIGYLPYRGAKDWNKGEKMWIPLDPSYKQYEERETQDISGQIQFNPDEYLSQVQFLPPTLQYFEQITATPNTELQNILRLRAIIPQTLGFLPAGLPYRALTTTPNRYPEIPDNLRHKINISVSGISYATNISQIVNKRVTLSYIPASSEDELIIQSYGGLYNTPAYLISVKPELKIEGNTTATGSSVRMGIEQTLSLNFTSPALNLPEDIITDEITAGTYLAIGVDALRVPGNIYSAREQNISQLTNKTVGQLIDEGDSGIGELLYFTSINYHNQLNLSEKMLSPLVHIVSLKYTAEAKTKLALSVDYIFDIPNTVSVTGIAFDVGRLIYSPFPKAGEQDKKKQFVTILGYTSSFYEHASLENIFRLEGISAVKAIQIAREQGITVYDIDSTNMNSILPLLEVSDSIKQEIQNSINAGLVVKIPQRNITAYNWTGVGYIITDPNTGAGAYMISGGMAGGIVMVAGGEEFIVLHELRSVALTNGSFLEETIPFISHWYNFYLGQILWMAGYVPLFNFGYTKKEFLDLISTATNWIFFYNGHGNQYTLGIQGSGCEDEGKECIRVEDVKKLNPDYKIVFISGCGTAQKRETGEYWPDAFGIDQIYAKTFPREEIFLGWMETVNTEESHFFAIRFFGTLKKTKKTVLEVLIGDGFECKKLPQNAEDIELGRTQFDCSEKWNLGANLATFGDLNTKLW